MMNSGLLQPPTHLVWKSPTSPPKWQVLAITQPKVPRGSGKGKLNRKVPVFGTGITQRDPVPAERMHLSSFRAVLDQKALMGQKQVRP